MKLANRPLPRARRLLSERAPRRDSRNISRRFERLLASFPAERARAKLRTEKNRVPRRTLLSLYHPQHRFVPRRAFAMRATNNEAHTQRQRAAVQSPFRTSVLPNRRARPNSRHNSRALDAYAYPLADRPKLSTKIRRRVHLWRRIICLSL